jgi:hypothetical protein
MRELILWNMLFGSGWIKKRRTGFWGVYDRLAVSTEVIVGFIIASIVILFIELHVINR